MGQASYTAQVRGTVTDQTGAVVVNALVTITNDGTNVSTSVRTDDHGLYLLTGLRPSTYTIKVEAAGFRSAESKNVVLAVDQQATLELQPEARRLQHHGGRDRQRLPCSIPTAPPSERTSAMNTCATSLCTTGAFSVWCFWLGE